MPWWGDVLFLIVAGIAVWGFASLVGFRTRTMSSKTDRTAENLPQLRRLAASAAPVRARTRGRVARR